MIVYFSKTCQLICFSNNRAIMSNALAVIIGSSINDGGLSNKCAVARKGNGGLRGIMADVKTYYDLFVLQCIEIMTILANVGCPNRSDVIETLRKLFSAPGNYEWCVIAYSGHGTCTYDSNNNLIPLGNWCFANNEYLTLSDILDLWDHRDTSAKNRNLFIIADCCFSGVWTRRLHVLDRTDIIMQSATCAIETAEDSIDGGLFTQFYKKLAHTQVQIFNTINLLVYHGT